MPLFLIFPLVNKLGSTKPQITFKAYKHSYILSISQVAHKPNVASEMAFYTKRILP